MKKDSKIYIAGHKGMVGSSLMRMLQKEGYFNIVTRSHSELDLTRQNEVEKFFERETPEYVFLAAAKVGGILANDTYKGEFIYNNIMIAVNIIHTAYKSGVIKLLNLGSSCIYPKFAPQPMREDVLLTGSFEPTNEPYAIAKISALKLCRYYNEQYGTDFISVMPANLYGPHDNFNLETSHVIPALIRKFHLAKLLRNKEFVQLQRDIQAIPLGYDMNGKSVVVNEESVRKALERLGITEDYVIMWGAGEVYREFLHVEDLANACIFLMENYNYKVVGELVNIGTGVDIKIKDLAALVKKIIGYEGEIKYDLSMPEGTPRKLLDVSKVRRLGWKAKINLEEGLKKTYDWYCMGN
jgi:GDP-L-fucose synthase